MVFRTQQNEIIQAGFTAVGPMFDVVAMQVVRVRTARKSAGALVRAPQSVGQCDLLYLNVPS